MSEVLSGRRPDRVPVSVWLHNFTREQTPADLIAETLRLQEKFQFDFVKPQSPWQSACVLWGTEVPQSASADEFPIATRFAVRKDGDVEGITHKPVTGMLADQVEVMRDVRAALGPDTPVVATIFSPMMTLSFMHETGKAGVLSLMHSNPRALAKALANIAKTLTDFAKQVMDIGIDGVFYASTTCNSGELNRTEHDDFHAPFDAQILDACAGGWMNILHLCGTAVEAEFFAGYAPPIFSWDTSPENPTLSEMHELTDKVVLSGIPGKPAFGETSAEDLEARVAASIAEMDGMHQIIGPGCSVNPGGDETLISAVVNAARKPRPT